MTHQTCWLESTGVCGVRQNQAGGSSVSKGQEQFVAICTSLSKDTKLKRWRRCGMQTLLASGIAQQQPDGLNHCYVSLDKEHVFQHASDEGKQNLFI